MPGAGPNPGSRSGRLDEQARRGRYGGYRLIRSAIRILMRSYASLRLEGAELLPAEPSVVCFSHQNWIDPLFLISALPASPRTYFFGPSRRT